MRRWRLSIGFDWDFWSVGVLRHFADAGLIVVLIGPARLNFIAAEAA